MAPFPKSVLPRLPVALLSLRATSMTPWRRFASARVHCLSAETDIAGTLWRRHVTAQRRSSCCCVCCSVAVYACALALMSTTGQRHLCSGCQWLLLPRSGLDRSSAAHEQHSRWPCLGALSWLHIRPQVTGDSALFGHSGTDMAVRGLHAKAVRGASAAGSEAANAAEQVRGLPLRYLRHATAKLIVDQCHH